MGGVLNALAGGGSLVTFPALLFAGLNPIDANASSVVTLFPAALCTVWAYRRSASLGRWPIAPASQDGKRVPEGFAS